MNSDLPLGPGAEFDRLRAIFARLGAVGQGLGDDTALLRLGATTLAVSMDLSLEGVHFRTEWLSFAEIGWRATAAALSDLAAEGAKPVGVLVSLGVPGGRGKREGGRATMRPRSWRASRRRRSMSAPRCWAATWCARSATSWMSACSGTVQRPVRRSGAHAGDGVWVTGELGGVARALEGFRSRSAPEGALRERFSRPMPRIPAGRWLAQHGARAMIDISDGLAADAGHLAAASGIALEIELERIPCWSGMTPRDALASGEEYELLVALPKGFGERSAQAFTRATGLALTLIGRCVKGAGVRLTEAGRSVPAPAGFDHFAP